MLRLTSEIQFGQFLFGFVNSIEITSSWEDLSDVASITIPRRLQFEGRDIIGGPNPLLKRNDPAVLNLGYIPSRKKAFEGFISEINPDVPLIISCQDSALLLKQRTITKSFKPFKLSSFLEEVLADPFILPNGQSVQIPFVIAADFEFDVLRTKKNENLTSILSRLRDLGIYCWFRNGILYAGLSYVPDLAEKHRFEFKKNIISSSLQYQREDDIKLKVVLISNDRNGEKIKVEIGDEEGETRTLNYYKKTEEELRFLGEQEIEKLKFEGYRGGFTTFGEPFVNHGDDIEIIDPDQPEKNGVYKCKRVTRSFGVGGYRQEIELDIKIGDIEN